MNINRLFAEIWEVDKNWSLGCDRFRGIYLYNVITGVAFYGDSVEDVARKVWLSIYSSGTTLEVLPPSYGMVKG